MQRRVVLPKLSDFARRLSLEWKSLALTHDFAREALTLNIIVGVSGGADSLALLLGLTELVGNQKLKANITAAHLNHGLRGACADEDASAVREFARRLDCECVIEKIDVRGQATATRDNLEQTARRVRYDFFARTAKTKNACVLCLAHTLDDQAETVLLRLARGSGSQGLGAMQRVRNLNASDNVSVVRPLLSWARRADTENYCTARGFEFCLDASNDNENLARVRVRKALLPHLRQLNPRVVETLARTADLLRADDEALNSYAADLLGAAKQGLDTAKTPATAEIRDAEIEKSAAISVKVLLAAPIAVRRRALRLWIIEKQGSLRRIEAQHIAALEKLLVGARGGRFAELPNGVRVERRQGKLIFNFP